MCGESRPSQPDAWEPWPWPWPCSACHCMHVRLHACIRLGQGIYFLPFSMYRRSSSFFFDRIEAAPAPTLSRPNGSRADSSMSSMGSSNVNVVEAPLFSVEPSCRMTPKAIDVQKFALPSGVALDLGRRDLGRWRRLQHKRHISASRDAEGISPSQSSAYCLRALSCTPFCPCPGSLQ